MSSPAQLPFAPPQKKKTPVWVWILAGIGGAIALLILLVVGAGLFFVSKVAELAQNPAELGKLIARANPDLELLDSDAGKKILRVRNKRDGSTVTLKLEDILTGKLQVSKEDKDGLETVELGGKMKLPNWVPKFPGVEPASLGSAQSDKQGEGGLFTFTTSVSAEKIRAFYQEGFEKRGLAVKVEAGGKAALMMQSEDEALNATVKIEGGDGSEHRVTVLYGEKRR